MYEWYVGFNGWGASTRSSSIPRSERERSGIKFLSPYKPKFGRLPSSITFILLQPLPARPHNPTPCPSCHQPPYSAHHPSHHLQNSFFLSYRTLHFNSPLDFRPLPHNSNLGKDVCEPKLNEIDIFKLQKRDYQILNYLLIQY